MYHQIINCESVFNYFPVLRLLKVKHLPKKKRPFQTGSWTLLGPVRNLRVMASDPNEPSVTITWDPPLGSYITSYEVWFLGDCVHMTGVDSYTTSVRITREMGLEPLRLCHFEVRAMNQDLCYKGEWSKVSKFVGMWW